MKTWRLDSPAQTMVFASDGGIPFVAYWGASLPLSELPENVARSNAIDITGGTLDKIAPLSLCPQPADMFPGQPGLRVRDQNATQRFPVFTLSEANITDSSLQFTATAEDITIRFYITAKDEVFKLSTTLSSEAEIQVDWLAAPVLPAPASSTQTNEFTGKWCGEFQQLTVPWSTGARLRESVTGRTGHETFPGLLIPVTGATETGGNCYGFHYGWSGGHKMITEHLPDGRRQVQFGHATDIKTSGHHFETAPLYATFSDQGTNGIGHAFQSFVRNHIVDFPTPERPRPVHYNCWEAIYFDHKLEDLRTIAAKAADLGAERFVLDDGWFGKRDDDTSSLGDWNIDARKYPEGLEPLIDHVHARGMTFGIWFEPEMVNPDSDLLRAHPDWLLGPADQTLGRNQLVLDLSQMVAQDHLFNSIDAILAAHPIDYIKWDHNRVLPFIDKRQTQGFYDLVDRLRKSHPTVEFESCSSGGGRIDYGVLSRMHRVWLSDSNDALERWKMQTTASLFLPSEITGSHVGPRHCHTSGRVLPMQFRAWVAASRHMGFEMDPNELTDDEAAILKDVTAWYKENRDWMHAGIISRLETDDPAMLGEIQIAQDGSRFVAFLAQMDTSGPINPPPFRLTNLNGNARYEVTLRNPEDAAEVTRGDVALRNGPLTLSGQYLMQQGINLPIAFPATMWVVQGTKLP